ncbi:hypothetical protein JCM11754A_06250 [Isoptericola variabilis]
MSLADVDQPLCEHGVPTARKLRSGRPACPMCRRHEDAREEARRQTIAALARLPHPRADTTALAAHDD